MKRRSTWIPILALALVGAGACSAAGTEPRGDAFPTVDPNPPGDAGSVPSSGDASTSDELDAGAAPDGQCASSFGSSLTPGFGRMDGIIYAVQKPSDKGCAFPNNTHLILQVAIKGSVHRAAIALSSTRAGTDPRMRLRTMTLPLLGPPFGEGWHTSVKLDYVNSLGLHDGDEGGFTSKTKDELIAALASELVIGAKISIYATSDKGRPDSAHLVHRNDPDEDGALVIDPAGDEPKYLLFHFDGQDF